MLKVVWDIAGGHELQSLSGIELGGLLQEGRLECCLVEAQAGQAAQHMPEQDPIHCVTTPLCLYLLEQPHHCSSFYLQVSRPVM